MPRPLLPSPVVYGHQLRPIVDEHSAALDALEPRTDALEEAGIAGFDSIPLMLADTALAYSSLAVGEFVRAGEHFYEVVGAGETDYHLATAGGVKVKALLGERGYDVRAFGAPLDGVGDDRPAIQAALAAQAASSTSVSGVAGGSIGYAVPVYIPQARVRLSAPVQITSGYFTIESDQAVVTPLPGFTGQAAFTHAAAFRGVIRGLQPRGFPIGFDIANANTNSSHVVLDACGMTECTIGVMVDLQSAYTEFRNCRWRSCPHEVVVIRGDHVRINGGWASRGVIDLGSGSALVSVLTAKGFTSPTTSAARYTAGIVVGPQPERITAGGKAVLSVLNLVGVPTTQTITEAAWIALHNGASVDVSGTTRFGGETGSHAVVNNYCVADTSSPITPTYIRLSTADIYCAADDRAAIRLFALPNHIVVRDCSGFPAQRYIAWSSTVDGAAQAAIVAAITPTDVSQSVYKIVIDGNVTSYAVQDGVELPLIPDNLAFLAATTFARVNVSSGGSLAVGTPDVVAANSVSIAGTTANPATLHLANPADALNAGDTLGQVDYYSGDNSGAAADQVVARVSGHQSATTPSGGYLSISTASAGALAEALRVTQYGALRFIPRTAPTSPAEGDAYYDSGTKRLRVWDGTAWNNCW